jgi:FkbM family methyltransferase
MILSDQCLLAVAATLCKCVHIPGRVLDAVGLDLFRGNEWSSRWEKAGIRACRINGSPFWAVLNMSHVDQRRAYVYGRGDEAGLLKIMTERLGQGDVFIDIGANLGLYAMTGAHLIGDTGVCWAVEPNPNNYRLLLSHIALNRIKNIHPIMAALAQQPGTATMHVKRAAIEGKDEAQGRESTLGTLRELRQDGVDSIDVEVITGDVLFSEIPSHAKGVCKIDVEGYERNVLMGMREFIRSHPLMVYVVEVTPAWITEIDGGKAEDIVDIFIAAGHKAFILDNRGVPREYKCMAEVGFQANMVFAREPARLAP